ncbi:A24 family peptidase [soil metagenome]
MIWWGLAGFTGGAIIGSFVATLVIRWPRGRNTGGRSACDSCSVRLRWFELVPLFSCLVQRGKCRRCAAPISTEHFAIESVCAIVGATALLADPGFGGIAGACFGWLLVALAGLDFRNFWLPDRLTFLLGITGFATGALGLVPALADRLIGGAAGFGTLAIIAWSYARVRHRQGMGAGDPKLLGAIGLWLGWQTLPFVLLGASVLGLCLSLAMLARKQTVTGETRLPLGALMAVAAFPIWIFSR